MPNGAFALNNGKTLANALKQKGMIKTRENGKTPRGTRRSPSHHIKFSKESQSEFEMVGGHKVYTTLGANLQFVINEMRNRRDSLPPEFEQL